VKLKFFQHEHLQLAVSQLHLKPVELIVFVIPGPVVIKPFLEMTGPEKVVFAILLSSKLF
jgi:hypothetical protein